MKQLSKEQQKQILQNLLQEQKKQAEEIIAHHGAALSLSLIHISEPTRP